MSYQFVVAQVSQLTQDVTDPKTNEVWFTKGTVVAQDKKGDWYIARPDSPPTWDPEYYKEQTFPQKLLRDYWEWFHKNEITGAPYFDAFINAPKEQLTKSR